MAVKQYILANNLEETMIEWCIKAMKAQSILEIAWIILGIVGLI
jgi:hypothetical protein